LRLSLHLQDDVPPSLLLMSRLMYLPEDVPEIEKIRVAINALPGVWGLLLMVLLPHHAHVHTCILLFSLSLSPHTVCRLGEG
jgi:hypothetical protein